MILRQYCTVCPRPHLNVVMSVNLQVLLDDHIVKTLTMKGSPFVVPFEAELKEWESKLVSLTLTFFPFLLLKPRANRRNVAVQQLPTLLDFTCCVRLHTPLDVVGSSCAKFETGQTLSSVQTDATAPNIAVSVCRKKTFFYHFRAVISRFKVSASILLPTSFLNVVFKE